MKDSNEPRISRGCRNCALRDSSFFCNFSADTLQAFEAIKNVNSYRKGARLFNEGQPSEGIFVLCRGRVKLTTYSRNGKALILRIAGPGNVLGLSAALSGSVQETTAEVIEPCQANFVRKSDFNRFLENHPDAGMNTIRHLCFEYKTAYSQIRSLGLSSCVADKLAALLLEWSKNGISNNGSVRVKNSFSHEAIAEMIGTTRETVTRLFKDFRERELVYVEGSDLYIRDKSKLESTIGNDRRHKSLR